MADRTTEAETADEAAGTTTPTNNVNPKQIEELRQQFHIFDVNGSGYIEHDDMKQALLSLRNSKNDGKKHHVTDNEVQQMIQRVDLDRDGKLNFEEFVKWNQQMFVEEIKVQFQQMDQDSSGYLDKRELKALAKQLSYKIGEEELDDLCYSLDTDQNDRISFDEFLSGMAAVQSGRSYYVINGEMYIAKLKSDFMAIDVDGNGVVDATELQAMATKINYALSEEELRSLLQDMDANQDGQISLDEFIASAVKMKVGES